MEMCSILMGFFYSGATDFTVFICTQENSSIVWKYFYILLHFWRSQPKIQSQQNINQSFNLGAWKTSTKIPTWHYLSPAAISNKIKTFTVTQRQEKSAGQKNLGGSREPRCGRVQGERWHASWVWGKTDDSQIAKMDLRLPIWRISSSLTDLLCLSVCQHPAVQAAIH